MLNYFLILIDNQVHVEEKHVLHDDVHLFDHIYNWKYYEAEQTYEKAIKIVLNNFPSAHPILADTYHNMAGMFYSMKDYSNALTYYEKTRTIEEKFLPSNHPSIASTSFNIATVYEGLQDYKTAINYAEKAVQIAHVAFGNEHSETKENLNYLEQLRQKAQNKPDHL